MNLKSGLGLGTGRLINYLNIENCGNPVNLFLIPEMDLDKCKKRYLLVISIICPI